MYWHPAGLWFSVGLYAFLMAPCRTWLWSFFDKQDQEMRGDFSGSGWLASECSTIQSFWRDLWAWRTFFGSINTYLIPQVAHRGSIDHWKTNEFLGGNRLWGVAVECWGLYLHFVTQNLLSCSNACQMKSVMPSRGAAPQTRPPDLTLHGTREGTTLTAMSGKSPPVDCFLCCDGFNFAGCAITKLESRSTGEPEGAAGEGQFRRAVVFSFPPTKHDAPKDQSPGILEEHH